MDLAGCCSQDAGDHHLSGILCQHGGLGGAAPTKRRLEACHRGDQRSVHVGEPRMRWMMVKLHLGGKSAKISWSSAISSMIYIELDHFQAFVLLVFLLTSDYYRLTCGWKPPTIAFPFRHRLRLNQWFNVYLCHVISCFRVVLEIFLAFLSKLKLLTLQSLKIHIHPSSRGHCAKGGQFPAWMLNCIIFIHFPFS